MNKIVQFKEFGGPEKLQFTSLEPGKLEAGEVLFKVDAFALNRADILFLNGHHYSLPNFPSRIGSEAAGVVEAVGSGVTNFKPGDKVSSIPFHNDAYGTQGEWAIVPEQYLCSWPDSLSAEEACSVWMQYLTAYYALFEVGKLTENDYVLIPAASSSAGIGAIQLTEEAGAKAIATTRTQDKAEFLLTAGASFVVVTEDENLAERILEITGGQGVRLVYDPIAGSFTKAYLDALARHAIIFLYGLLGGDATEVDIVAMVRKAAVIHPYSMFNHVCEAEQLEKGKDYIFSRLLNGSLRPLVDRVFDFEQTLDAYRYMETNQQKGKIVVKTTA
ncbi:MAG: zinc-binding dehydrogenase [Gammaproteobacteria bacterium]|nr:zinc-binding dehydrogenase [Gammaproteobacteria bacterium]